MNRFLLLLALVVSVVWGQPRIVLETEVPPVTLPTAAPLDRLEAVCIAQDAVSEAEQALDNPADSQFDITPDESQKLLTALEAEGIEGERRVAEATNANFAPPNTTEIALIKWPCPSLSTFCPHYWSRMYLWRYNGPCGVEYCRPLPWYRTWKAVCSCKTCRGGGGICVPAGIKSRLLLAFCRNQHIGWSIRAVRVKVPTRCECRSICRG